MESPLLIIRVKKKKLTQWLRHSHSGKPLGSAAVTAGITIEGSDGKPNTRYCSHAVPTVKKTKAKIMTSAYGFMPMNIRLSCGKRIACSASLKFVNNLSVFNIVLY